MEVVQDIGAYAGFAAVIGLAILASLYFSQARDVKRLRDWAGRAPERAAQQQAEVAARVATKPAAQPAPAQPAEAKQPAAPAKKPAPAKQPVPAKQPAPATGGNAGAAVTPAPAPAQTPAPAKAPAPATASAAATAGKQSEAAVAEAPTPAPTAAPKVPKPTPKPSATPARTAVLPPTAKARAQPPSGRRWPAPRYIVLIVVGVLVVGGGAAYGVSELLKDDEPATPASAPGGGGDGANEEKRARRAPINPSTITVAVLNGTQVPGLAAQFADKIEAEGFQRGNTANNTDQSKAESVVLYASGASRAARSVANRLGVSQTEPIDAESQALAGDATVVVVVGGDQTQ